VAYPIKPSVTPKQLAESLGRMELLGSVGNQRNLAVCASMILFCLLGSFYAARVPRCSAGINSRFSRSTARSQATILRDTASVALFLLPFSIAL
jgi:hypothetical protein